MDQSRFDDLTRALGGASTRRAGLRAALGGLLGLASLPAAESRAKKSKNKRAARCGPDKPCPDGQVCDGEGTSKARCACPGGGRACGAVCCPDGQRCNDDTINTPVCRCESSGRPPCGGACCSAGELCADGACSRTTMCPSGQDLVGGECVCRTPLCGGVCCKQHHLCQEGACVRRRRTCDDIDGEDLSYCLFENRDFSGESLRNVNLEGAAFSGCVLKDFTFSGCRLDLAFFGNGTVMTGARFVDGTSMRGATFPGVGLNGARFDGVDATGARFEQANLGKADISGSTFDGVDFRNTHLMGGTPNIYDLSVDYTSFRACSLRGAPLAGIDLSATKWVDCDMSGAGFAGSTAKHAHFERTNLGKADFSSATFGGYGKTNLLACDMRGATFTGAKVENGELIVRRTDMREATFSGAWGADDARWSDVNLTDAVGWAQPQGGYWYLCHVTLPDGTQAPDRRC